MKLMHEFAGVVAAPPSQVEDRLRARMPGFAPVAPGVFALQGGWWCRGGFHPRPEAGGTRPVFGRSVRPDSDPRDLDLAFAATGGSTDVLHGDRGPA